MTTPPLLVYHYKTSPFAQRLVHYLTLTKTPFVSIYVNPILPRPELNALGISYRQVPLLAVGRDIYCDTSLIIDKLEHMNGSKLSYNKGVEDIIESWAILRVFPVIAKLIPPDTTFLKSKRFVRDREEWSGRSWKPEDLAAERENNLENIGRVLNLLEHEIFASHDWINGSKISVSDIHTAFGISWAIELDMFGEVYSEQTHPKVYSWIKRYRQKVKQSSEQKQIKGEEAESILFSSNLPAEPDFVEDVSGLKRGDHVEIYPEHWNHTKDPQSGLLIGLTWTEAVLKVGEDDRVLHVHFPRERYTIRGKQRPNL